MTDLSHIGPAGDARMVDVTAKEVTERTARAQGVIRMKPETLAAIQRGNMPKGDVFSVARIAGIMAAKRTAELIPLCHPLPLTDVQLSFVAVQDLPGLRVEAVVRTVAKTGVEMEAITAAAVALVTIFDMSKAIDKTMQINDIRLVEKSGGKSGVWKAG